MQRKHLRTIRAIHHRVVRVQSAAPEAMALLANVNQVSEAIRTLDADQNVYQMLIVRLLERAYVHIAVTPAKEHVALVQNVKL